MTSTHCALTCGRCLLLLSFFLFSHSLLGPDDSLPSLRRLNLPKHSVILTRQVVIIVGLQSGTAASGKRQMAYAPLLLLPTRDVSKAFLCFLMASARCPLPFRFVSLALFLFFGFVLVSSVRARVLNAEARRNIVFASLVIFFE